MRSNYLKVAILINENVAGFLRRSVNGWFLSGRTSPTRSRCTTPAECTYFKPLWTTTEREGGAVDKRTYKNLIQEILDELFFQRPGSQQSVQIGPQKFGDKVSVVGDRRRWFDDIRGALTSPLVGR